MLPLVGVCRHVSAGAPVRATWTRGTAKTPAPLVAPQPRLWQQRRRALASHTHLGENEEDLEQQRLHRVESVNGSYNE